MYLCVRGIHFVPFYDVPIIFQNCSDSVVYFFVCCFSFFRLIKCIRGIEFACDFNDFSIRFWNCSDMQCGIFFFSLGIITQKTYRHELFYNPLPKLAVEINVRGYRRDNQKWTIQINWQHLQNEDKQNKNTTQYTLDTTMRKQIQET